jgi:hypothetical protein
MSDFGITCSVKEGVGDSFDISSTNSDSVGVDLMNVSVKENFCITPAIVPSKIVSKHPQLNPTKVGAHQGLPWGWDEQRSEF